MKCAQHNEKEATAICVSCGTPICNDCGTLIQGKHYCDECSGTMKENDPLRRRKVINGFLWFVFSLVPGAGHMYMGLMQKGVLLLGIFLGLAALVSILGIFDFALALGSVLVYVYAFFDSLGMKRAIERGEIVEDRGLEGLNLGKINLYYVGIGIVVLGVFSLIETFIQTFGYLPIVMNIYYGFRRSVLPIFLIVLGIWLIRRSKKEKEGFNEDRE
ncbi:MAG TPA: hypothetical protein GXZ78_02290 [Eubacteriaceae bacterium]|nr:hypothetical protein [Eubacteriaceae bacterium]